jgi:hypothetical protein
LETLPPAPPLIAAPFASGDAAPAKQVEVWPR